MHFQFKILYLYNNFELILLKVLTMLLTLFYRAHAKVQCVVIILLCVRKQIAQTPKTVKYINLRLNYEKN